MCCSPFPALVLLIAITSFWGRDLYKIVIALAILTIAPLARLVQRQHARVRPTRLRHRVARPRSAQPKDHLARDPAERRARGPVVRAADRRHHHRRRERPLVPGSGAQHHDRVVGDAHRAGQERPAGRSVGRAVAGHDHVPHRAGAQSRRRAIPRPLRRARGRRSETGSPRPSRASSPEPARPEPPRPRAPSWRRTRRRLRSAPIPTSIR